MPLSEPEPRERLHRRRLELDGYRREDGLFDIEARLVDRKDYAFDLAFRGRLPPGEPVHDLSMRVTLDERMTIHAVETAMDVTPFPSCPGAEAAFQRLVGLRIGSGWMREARERVGGVAGCTHLLELLPPVATAAYQTIAPLRRRSAADRGRRPPPMIDSCHGWRRDGEAVRELFPDWSGPAED